MVELKNISSPLHYDGPPRRDKDGKIIEEFGGSGCGCLIYPLFALFLVLAVGYTLYKIS
jgi:hypothetical protein